MTDPKFQVEPPRPVPIQQTLLSAGQTQLTKDDYYTPKAVFDALGLTFDLDVCAPPGGVPWGTGAPLLHRSR